MPKVGRIPALGLALTFIATVATVRLWPSGSDGNHAVSELGTAVGPHRVSLARLAGPYAYVPCVPATPNDSLIHGLLCSDSRPDTWSQAPALRRVASRLRGAPPTRAASTTHTIGVWNVLWGQADAAIEELRAAAERSPRDGAIRSDLAAAMLMRAEQHQDPRWILEAFSAADSAVILAPALPEARFNRALILERLALRRDAALEWNAFLAIDSVSAWAQEARSHIRQLERPRPRWEDDRIALDQAVEERRDSVAERITRLFPKRVSEEVRLTLLDWAWHYQRGDTQSDSVFPRALALSRALATATGDLLWLDAVRELVDCTERHDRRRLDAAARGFVAYDSGRAYLARVDGKSATPWLVEASRAQRAANNAAQYLVDYELSRIPFIAGHSAEAIAAAQHVLDVTPNAYPRVRARAANNIGVLHGIDANYRAAIEASLAAVREGVGTGDPALDLDPRTNIALNYADLGFDELAWRHLYAALQTAPTYADLDADVRLVMIVAARLTARDMPAIASLFQREATRFARSSPATRPDSLRLISALGRQAELQGRAGHTNLARESVQEARTYLAALPSDSVSDSFRSSIDLVDGFIWLHANPDSAVRILRRVVTRYRETHYQAEFDHALLLLANAYAASGAMDSARESFAAAIAETERRRATTSTVEDRQRLLDVARPVIDEIIAFLADRADTVGALRFMESMRSRVLLEQVSAHTNEDAASQSAIDVLRSQLPAGTAIISYAVLPREVIAWYVDRGRVTMHRTSNVGELERLTNRFSVLIQSRSDDPEIRSVSSQLHRLLLAPFANELASTSRVIVIPDKWLHFVPFNALYDDATNTFAIERFDIGMAPSVQLYEESAARYRALWSASPPSVLAVGNPAFDSRTFSLPPLPGAQAEAEAVARLYASSRLMVGSAATKPAFLAAAGNANVVHFAGHGVVRPDAPLASHLLLASTGTNDTAGMLTAREIFGVRLGKTRLAILSGCQTASGQISDTEGPSSLARALFAAGVPAVVASLWAVDDIATSRFFTAYHRRLSRGEDPTTALRRTQQEWLADSTDRWHLATWAAFAIYGSTTDVSAAGSQSQ